MDVDDWNVVILGLLFAAFGWYLFHDPVIGGLIGLFVVVLCSN